MAARCDIEIETGATFTRELTMTQFGEPISHAGTWRGQIRREKLSTSTLIADFDCTVVDDDVGPLRLVIEAETTQEMEALGVVSAWWDLLWTDEDSRTRRVLEGIVTIDAGVTADEEEEEP